MRTAFVAPPLACLLAISSIGSIAAAEETPTATVVTPTTTVVTESHDHETTIINNVYVPPPTIYFVHDGRAPKPPKPIVRSYEEGQYIPDGFHLEDRRSTGLIIAGSIVGGLGALLFVAAVPAASDGTHSYSSAYGSSSTSPSSSNGAFLALGAVMAVGGIVMLVAGLQTHKVLVEDTPTFAFAAAPTKDGAAFSLSGSF